MWIALQIQFENLIICEYFKKKQKNVKKTYKISGLKEEKKRNGKEKTYRMMITNQVSKQ